MTSSVRFRSVPKVGRNAATGLVMQAQRATFDPTAASAATGIVLPAGSYPVAFLTDGGASGGTNPTVDIGKSGSTAFWGNEVDADAVALTTPADQTVQTADTAVWAGVGASAATAGTVQLIVLYMTDPDNTNYVDPSSE